MDKFLLYKDDTGRLIQNSAAELYMRLINLNADHLGMPDHCLQYFKTSHSTRLFFSIETSAHLLYKAIRLSNKNPAEIVLMDYGAGVGTLFLLAKMIGCRQVIYNDHLQEWQESAEIIARAIHVKIDAYVVGDIHDCLEKLDALNISCDIITSRNVIEHIYKLDEFYAAVYAKQPQAIIFSSTTANKNNPASVLKHKWWHRKWEKVFRGMRLAVIQRELLGAPAEKMRALATSLRGKAGNDMINAIREYKQTGILPDPSVHGTNTCDPSNGVWAEHLLSLDEYRKLINENAYEVSFEAGFWDTHYRKKYLNAATFLFNTIINKGGNNALRLAPFIYVIAKPRQTKY